jgi:hypothetical protein
MIFVSWEEITEKKETPISPLNLPEFKLLKNQHIREQQVLKRVIQKDAPMS